jgi:glutamate racemase
MAAVEGEGPLAVIATAASIKSGQFTEPLRALCPGREIVGVACPEFVPMIEAGHIAPDDPVVLDVVSRTLAPLKGRTLDALLLGCTHYGVIEQSIRAELGDVRLLSAATCGAEALRDALARRKLTSTQKEGGNARFYISSDPEPFEGFASRYLDMGPVRAERVPVMEAKNL